MSHDLSLARSHALDLARTLMVPVVLFLSGDEYGVLPADEIDDALAAWAEAPGQPAAGGRDRAIEQLERLATVARLVGMDEQAHAAGQLLSAALRCPAAADAHGAAVLRWLSSWRLPLTALFERPGEAEAAARWADYLAEEPRPATAEALPQPAADSPAQAEQHSV
ncbi:MAG: hypothetical protein JNM70_27215, partial [Anaerolineae bacterium]|nr:hypothetical protein [Anaerolineae bacterium]